MLWGHRMQLAEFGLITSALQLCVAGHAHSDIPRHNHTHNYALSSDFGSLPKAVSTLSTKSLHFLEADVGTQYQKVTMSAARQSMETPLGKQYRTSLRPTNIGPHFHLQAVPSQGWTGEKGANFTWRLGNHSSAVHHPTFHSTATPLINASLKRSISMASTRGTPKYHSSFSRSGSSGRRRAPRFAALIIILVLMGAALFIWS